MVNLCCFQNMICFLRICQILFEKGKMKVILVCLKLLIFCKTRRWPEVSRISKKFKYLVRGIKPPNHQICFPQFFSANCFLFDQLKKKTKFLLVQNRFFFNFGPMKVCFLYQLLLENEKNIWKKLGKIKLADVTNKIKIKTTVMRRISRMYRVSHIEMCDCKWFWGMEGSIILLISLWRHVLEQWAFEFHQSIFT